MMDQHTAGPVGQLGVEVVQRVPAALVQVLAQVHQEAALGGHACGRRLPIIDVRLEQQLPLFRGLGPHLDGQKALHHFCILGRMGISILFGMETFGDI